jgi:hypothetical protein
VVTFARDALTARTVLSPVLSPKATVE